MAKNVFGRSSFLAPTPLPFHSAENSQIWANLADGATLNSLNDQKRENELTSPGTLFPQDFYATAFKQVYYSHLRYEYVSYYVYIGQPIHRRVNHLVYI